MILGDTTTRVLLAVMSQHRPTVRSVAAAVGMSINGAHRHLRILRDAGLVQWEDGRAATLHPIVAPTRTPVRGSVGTGKQTGPEACCHTPRPLADTPEREVADLAANRTSLDLGMHEGGTSGA